MTIIVFVSAAAITIILSSISDKTAAKDKAQAQNFASDAWECFKVSGSEREFIENMRFAEGIELNFTEGVSRYYSEEFDFTAEIKTDYSAARPAFEISVIYREKELISFSYIGGGE